MRHVIQEQHLHVEFDGAESEAGTLQRRLRRFCYDCLVPVVEAALDDQVAEGEHVYMERIEVDAGTVTVENLELDLANALKDGLVKALREEIVSPRPSSRRRKRLQAVTEAFLYFLEQGTLPWWFQLPAGKALEQALIDCWHETGDRDGLSRILLEQAPGLFTGEPVRRRLILQFSEKFLSLLLPVLSPQLSLRTETVLERLKNLPLRLEWFSRISQQVWQCAFAAASRGEDIAERELLSLAWRNLPLRIREQPELAEALERHWPGVIPAGEEAPGQALAAGSPVKTADRQTVESGNCAEEPASVPPTEKRGIYLDNGGLVLLHPYLPHLFERLKISDGPQLLLPERAVAVLHYLASGSLDQPEFRVTLPKVLCAIPIQAPIPRNVQLTEKEREECDALLGVMIRHWGALGDSSPDGLRGTFLMRQAKLSRREDDEWLLQVESNSYDILLDQLPWSISMVKLPWMPKLLWVQWN